MIKILSSLLLVMFLGCSTLPEIANADDFRNIVNKCLETIKRGDYEGSYNYFSKSLKEVVKLEKHVNNLKDIEANYGKLKSYTYDKPFFLFKNYLLDENFIKKNTNISNVQYKLTLKYPGASLLLTAIVEKEDGDFKISTFYLEKSIK
jgi:hypothetical protein